MSLYAISRNNISKQQAAQGERLIAPNYTNNHKTKKGYSIMKKYIGQYKGIKIFIFDFINSSKQHIRREFMLKVKKIHKMLAQGYCEPVQIVTLYDKQNKATHLNEMQEVLNLCNVELLHEAALAYDSIH